MPFQNAVVAYGDALASPRGCFVEGSALVSLIKPECSLPWHTSFLLALFIIAMFEGVRNRVQIFFPVSRTLGSAQDIIVQ
jgi:hypothetical protein